jgi:hypothetical protein
MSKKRHSAEEIVNKLRQADVELGRGKPVGEVCDAAGGHSVHVPGDTGREASRARRSSWCVCR